MIKIAVYAGSFDPFTKGHEDVLLQSIKLFDKVFILVCDNPLKQSKSLYNRIDIIQKYIDTKELSNTVTVQDCLSSEATVDFASDNKAPFLIRGIRTISDFEYEMQIASMNKLLSADITTVYFTPSTKNQFTSSSMVREFLRLKKSIEELVPEEIIKEVKKLYE